MGIESLAGDTRSRGGSHILGLKKSGYSGLTEFGVGPGSPIDLGRGILLNSGLPINSGGPGGGVGNFMKKDWGQGDKWLGDSLGKESGME